MLSKLNGTIDCLFMGPLVNHAVMGRVAALLAADCNVHAINVGSTVWKNHVYPIPGVRVLDSLTDPFFRDLSKSRRFALEYLRDLGIMPENSQLVARLYALIDQVQPKVAVTHFGTTAMHYARILKRIAPKLPVVDIINLIPSSVYFRKGLSWLFHGWQGKLMEMTNYRNWLGYVDAVILASQEMKDFVQREFDLSEDKLYILPDYLPVTSQGNTIALSTNPERFDDDPRVIFLGAPERYGPLIDSIDDQFLDLAREAIHIHSGAISERVRSSGFGHVYPYFSDEEVFSGRLAEFATQFDAALVTYNVPVRQERFRSTYPTRFFAALTAGMPIAVRAGFFDACEHYVTENQLGFVYESAADLRLQLMDKARLSSMREHAKEHMRFSNAEAQGPKLRAILEAILR